MIVLLEDSWDADDIKNHYEKVYELSQENLYNLDSKLFINSIYFCCTDIVQYHLNKLGIEGIVPDTYDNTFKDPKNVKTKLFIFGNDHIFNNRGSTRYFTKDSIEYDLNKNRYNYYIKNNNNYVNVSVSNSDGLDDRDVIFTSINKDYYPHLLKPQNVNFKEIKENNNIYIKYN